MKSESFVGILETCRHGSDDLNAVVTDAEKELAQPPYADPCWTYSEAYPRRESNPWLHSAAWAGAREFRVAPAANCFCVFGIEIECLSEPFDFITRSVASIFQERAPRSAPGEGI